MSPSIYQGCVIEDTIGVALQEFRKSLEEARENANELLDAFISDMDSLSTPKQKGSAIIGTSSLDNEILWEALSEGEDGNSIIVFYDYLGPIWNGSAFEDRPPSSYVDSANPTHIHCILPITASANIDPAYPVSLCLPIWLTPLEVQNLVNANLVTTGSGLPEPVGGTKLTGGKGSPLPDSESAATDIARVFGKTSYQDLMTELGIPTLTDTASARAYLESLGEDFVIINGKILLVEGTNLVGIRSLYNALGKDLTLLKQHLSTMQSRPNLIYCVVTQNVMIPTSIFACGEVQTVYTVVEKYVATDKNINYLAKQKNVTVDSLNTYLYWTPVVYVSTQNYQRLTRFGVPTDYNEAIFAGTDAEVVANQLIQPPKVSTIEDPALLDKIQLTDAEIVELLETTVAGVKLPTDVTVDDLSNLLNLTLNKIKTVLPNGLTNKIKPAIAASQALDLDKIFQDKDRSQELATRGRACARQEKFFLDLPGLPDLPDVPFPNLPNPAKKIESLFGAISSGINAALDVFNSIWNGVKKLLNPILNKIQNLNSLADNLFNNNLAQCALGVGQAVTGFPDLGSGGVNPTAGGLGGGITPSIGGIPVPLDLFKKAMTELSSKTNEIITKAFTGVMQAISYPLCMAQTMLSSMTGAPETGAETTPCKDGVNPNDTCGAAEVQNIINQSAEMTSAMSGLPQLEGLPTTETATNTVKEVEAFTGRLNEFTVTTSQSITRGISQIVDELTKSLDSKLQLLDKFDAAIRAMGTDTQEVQMTGTANQQKQSGCAPPSVGMFTDVITQLL